MASRSSTYIPKLRKVILNHLSCDLLTPNKADGFITVTNTISVNIPESPPKENPIFFVSVSTELEGSSNDKQPQFAASCKMTGYYEYSKKEMDQIADRDLAGYIYSLQVYSLVRARLQRVINDMGINSEIPFMDPPGKVEDKEYRVIPRGKRTVTKKKLSKSS